MKNYYLKTANYFGWGPQHQIPDYKINELLPLVSGNRILDIGCGPGTFVNALSLRGFDATGIDITKQFISYAKKNYQGHFLIADAYKLPFSDQFFDTVFIRNVIEHLENDLTAIKEATRVGKKIIIVVPHQTPKNLKIRGLIFSHYQDRSHLRTYTIISLKKLISLTKSSVVQIRYSEKIPNEIIISELISGGSFLKKIIINFLLFFFKPNDYYLELIAIIKPWRQN